MRLSRRLMLTSTLAAALGPFVLGAFASQARAAEPNQILNASYDIARELFEAENKQFEPAYKAKTGKEIKVNQSHAGTSKQARSIVEGLEADVVTFNQITDIQFLVDKGFVAKDWQQRLPNASSPWYSFPAFLVREGNPKNVKNWDDLVRDDVKLVFPNPKTSGNARYTYLAAYAFALEKFDGDTAKADEFAKKLLSNVVVFDTGGRGATTSFVEREQGDVLITFEAEVIGVKDAYKDKNFQVVVPEVSLLAEFPVAVVDKVVDKRGSRQIATDYLSYLYTPEGQKIAAELNNRVVDPKVAEEFKAKFAPVRLVKVEDVFGGWANAQKVHFASGGKLDELFVAQ
ncbi:thiosulfate ABC transporter substrate-binding protein CysP [Ancylobacter dichloromethanicus]|uniref:Sulfate ABC transporter substrate-binding protein n=1 Tax=Ancylobacter dichloromethanicus TaxID=518825 RepID=A0A9W6J7Q7_9HYPH|nr:thiosulfate ABC transporter substrate-binding protein CysP [Ancylobacter dichloromethanicus]MBS7552542.1 thiosulfate ABC transporter substrate-binding protein CysP [Ancylobacter dichloromethanicus]GLK71902.1 sulfate ABC transporter substrate-binding protein [Ancylobacter dichloromethanicus]